MGGGRLQARRVGHGKTRMEKGGGGVIPAVRKGDAGRMPALRQRRSGEEGAEGGEGVEGGGTMARCSLERWMRRFH